MEVPRGRWVRLSWQRRLVADLMRLARPVPAVTVFRTMNLGPLTDARASCSSRPSWAVLFVKGFALLAQERPELRRIYQTFPWPHFYEHPNSTGMLTVERTDNGEVYPMIVRFKSPETTPVAEMSDKARHCKSAALMELSELREMRRLGRLPGFARRIIWWTILNLSGAVRARRVGTFGVSSLAADGAGVAHLISLTTSTLYFGEPTANNRLQVFLAFDHRVYDGGLGARNLKRLEEILNTEIVTELRGLAAARAA